MPANYAWDSEPTPDQVEQLRIDVRDLQLVVGVILEVMTWVIGRWMKSSDLRELREVIYPRLDMAKELIGRGGE